MKIHFTMRARVISWTRPIHHEHGLWQSTLLVEDDTTEQRIHVATRTAEDHVWITHVGTWVLVAKDGSVSTYPKEEEPPSKAPHYVNPPLVLMLTGFQRDEDDVFFSFFGSQRYVALCRDKEKQKQLLEAVGSTVKLYNVKVRWNGQWVIGPNSGIRVVEEKEEEKKKEEKLPPLPSRRWECLNCGHLNFATWSSCRYCDVTRRDGPLPLDWIRRKVKRPWQCHQCRYEPNFATSQWCWKCGAKKCKKSQTIKS